MANYRQTLLSCCLVLSVTSSAYAMSCRPYVGGGFGSNPSSWTFVNEVSSFAQKLDQTLDGTQWTAYGGCELDFNQFLVGLEVFGGRSNDKYRSTSTSANADEYQYIKANIGVAALPGYKINGQTLYGRIGAQWSELKYTTSSSTTNAYQFSEFRSGLIAGLGVSAPLGEYLALRNEYDHTFYKRVAIKDSGSQLKWIPSQDTYWLGLSVYLTGSDAEQQATMVSNPDGFYAGAGVGRSVARMKRRRINTGNVLTIIDQGMSGVLGQVLAGYDFHAWDRFQFGGEVIGEYTSDEFQFKDPEAPVSDFQYKLKDLYNFRAKVGINTAASNELFAVGGSALGHFTKSGNETNGANFNKYKWGWMVGIGDEVALTHDLSYRIEGDFMRFSTINNTGSTGNQLKWTPVNEQATVSLVYHLS